MYSGTTFTNKSGSVMGAHQKIDRTARKYLSKISDTSSFPEIKHILHFEGKNGPDGIKRKSPAIDEPWHFYDPFDSDDTKLLNIIEDHYSELIKQLKKGSPERAAFDAAWLAHALVDGLTPAHQFPYEKKLEELRGDDLLSRDSPVKKLFIPGDNTADSIKKNWAMWGREGLLSMHIMFEIGVAGIAAPLSMKAGIPSESDIERIIDVGVINYYKSAAKEIAVLDMYNRFLEDGWTRKLVRDVRNELMPTIIKTVTLIWFMSMREAGLLKGKK